MGRMAQFLLKKWRTGTWRCREPLWSKNIPDTWWGCAWYLVLFCPVAVFNHGYPQTASHLRGTNTL